MIRTDTPDRNATAPRSASGAGVVTYPPRIQANRRQIDDRFSSLGFTVDPGGRPWFEVLLATDASLFDPANAGRRTGATFYTSRRDAGLLPAAQAAHPFLVPSSVVRGFVAALPRPTSISYTMISYDGSDGSGPAFAHGPQSLATSAPAVAIARDFTGSALGTVLSVSVNKLQRLGNPAGRSAIVSLSGEDVEREDGYGAPPPPVASATGSGRRVDVLPAASSLPPARYPREDPSPAGYQLALLPGPEAGRPPGPSEATAREPLLPDRAAARQGRVFETAPPSLRSEARAMDGGAGTAVEAAGIIVGLVTSSESDVKWTLDAFNGVKHPNDVAPPNPPPLRDAPPILIKDWTLGWLDEIGANFQVDWQYNGTGLGNIHIRNISVNDAIGIALNVRATISQDNNIYDNRSGMPRVIQGVLQPLFKADGVAAGPDLTRKPCAALRILFDLTWEQTVGPAHKAAIDLQLFGDGTHVRYGRWIQHSFL
jgi:hypothetical protein